MKDREEREYKMWLWMRPEEGGHLDYIYWLTLRTNALLTTKREIKRGEERKSLDPSSKELLLSSYTIIHIFGTCGRGLRRSDEPMVIPKGAILFHPLPVDNTHGYTLRS